LLATWAGKSPTSGQTFKLGKGLVGFAATATTEELLPPPATDPSVVDAKAKPVKLGVPLKQLAPDFQAISHELRLGAQLQLESSSQLETTIRAKGDKRAIHLIRFGPTEQLQDRSVKVRYALPAHRGVKEVTVWAPGQTSPIPSKWEVSAQELRVNVDRVDSSAMVAIVLSK
jgi:hypothetical protein